MEEGCSHQSLLLTPGHFSPSPESPALLRAPTPHSPGHLHGHLRCPISRDLSPPADLLSQPPKTANGQLPSASRPEPPPPRPHNGRCCHEFVACVAVSAPRQSRDSSRRHRGLVPATHGLRCPPSHTSHVRSLPAAARCPPRCSAPQLRRPLVHQACLPPPQPSRPPISGFHWLLLIHGTPCASPCPAQVAPSDRGPCGAVAQLDTHLPTWLVWFVVERPTGQRPGRGQTSPVSRTLGSDVAKAEPGEVPGEGALPRRRRPRCGSQRPRPRNAQACGPRSRGAEDLRPAYTPACAKSLLAK